MLICLDYDETYTADPELWGMVIAAAQWRGHKVICATMRYESEGVELYETIGRNVEIVFTGRAAKKPYLEGLCIDPDIWIDDSPHWIFQDAA